MSAKGPSTKLDSLLDWVPFKPTGRPTGGVQAIQGGELSSALNRPAVIGIDPEQAKAPHDLFTKLSDFTSKG
jgi:hypothetical protein